VSCAGNPVLICVVQVDASQGRRGRDTGSYVDRGERREAPHGRRTSVADSQRRTLRVEDAVVSILQGAADSASLDVTKLLR
jgi:hypothetical protein